MSIKSNKKPNEKGNVLFLILIAVALFAALSYAVTQSGRGGSGNVQREKGLLDVGGAIQYAGLIQQGIIRLKLANGCSDTQINFDNDKLPTVYANPLAPLDKRCNIFDVAGGQITYAEPPSSISRVGPGYLFTGSYRECESASCAAPRKKLMMLMPGLTKEQCIAINNNVGLANPGGNPPAEADNHGFDGYFVGVYNSPAYGDWGDGGVQSEPLWGAQQGCLHLTGTVSYYTYFYVLENVN